MNTLTRLFRPVAGRAYSSPGLKSLGFTAAMVLVAGLLLGFVHTCQESVLRGEHLERQFHAQGRSEAVQATATLTATVTRAVVASVHRRAPL